MRSFPFSNFDNQVQNAARKETGGSQETRKIHSAKESVVVAAVVVVTVRWCIDFDYRYPDYQ